MSGFSNHLFFPRPEFVSKFTKLKDQWQSAAQGIRQRRREVDGLVRQWQYFTTSEEDLHHFLTDTSHVLSAVKSQDCYSLCQTRSLIHELKVVHAQSQCENDRVVSIQKMFIHSGFVFTAMSWFRWPVCNGEATWVGSLWPCPTLFLASWGQKPCLIYSARNSGALLGHGSKDGVERRVGRMGEVWGDRLTPPKFLRHWVMYKLTTSVVIYSGSPVCSWRANSFKHQSFQ